MGNSESVSIDIVLESCDRKGHAVVLAGTSLNGEVVVNVKKRIEGAPIMLHISGKEKVLVRNRASNVASKAGRPLVQVDLPLREFRSNSKIKPGVYTFPFSISLPNSLPSSDSFPAMQDHAFRSSGSKTGFRIQYRVSAAVDSLKKSQQFYVLSAPLPTEPVPVMVKPSFHQINSMKLFDAGQVGLGARLANSNVGRGEEVALFLACRNDSTVDIRSVDIKLIEVLKWSTVARKRDERENDITLATMKNVALPTKNMEKKGRNEVKRRKFDTDLQQATYRGIYDELQASQVPILIQIPNSARDSYQGELVQISHHLEITIQTSSLSNNTKSIIPLRVGTPWSPLFASSDCHRRVRRPSMGSTSSQASRGSRRSSTSNRSARTAPVVRRSNSSSSSVGSQGSRSSRRSSTQPSSSSGVTPSLQRSNSSGSSGMSLGPPRPRSSRNPPPTAPRTQKRSSGGSSCSQNIPMVEATAIPIMEPIRASLTAVPVEAIVLGGSAVMDNGTSPREISPLVASAPSAISDVPVSVQSLLRQMNHSVDCFDLITHHLSDERWTRLFGKIGPKAFGAIVSRVKNRNDQPRVARLLAPYMLHGERFTCAFAASAIRNTVETYRFITVQQLLPLCIDIAVHSGRIHKELNEWEQTITSRDFEEAILAATCVEQVHV